MRLIVDYLYVHDNDDRVVSSVFLWIYDVPESIVL